MIVIASEKKTKLDFVFGEWKEPFCLFFVNFGEAQLFEKKSHIGVTTFCLFFTLFFFFFFQIYWYWFFFSFWLVDWNLCKLRVVICDQKEVKELFFFSQFCFSFVFPILVVFELCGGRNPSGYCGDLGLV